MTAQTAIRRRPCPRCGIPAYPVRPVEHARYCWTVCSACRTEVRQELYDLQVSCGNSPLLVPWIAQNWWQRPEVSV